MICHDGMRAATVVRVAAVQAAPVILDAEASVAKAVDLIWEAANVAPTWLFSPKLSCPSILSAPGRMRGESGL